MLDAVVAPSLTPQLSRDPANAVGLGALRRELALGRLLTHPGVRDRRYRSLRWSALFLVISGLLSIWGLAALGAGEAADVIALRLLAYASWLYGGLGLSALLAVGAGDPSELARLRGQNPRHLLHRSSGMAFLLARGIFFTALPGLLLAALVLPDARALPLRLLLIPLSGLYACALGASLAAVGTLAERITPRSPRILAALILLVPYAFSFAEPTIPSIPGFFSWFLDQLLLLGASAT